MLKIITDSAADVPKNEAEQYDIRVMGIPITVDGVSYRESVDFTSEEYYGMLTAAKAIPTADASLHRGWVKKPHPGSTAPAA